MIETYLTYAETEEILKSMGVCKSIDELPSLFQRWNKGLEVYPPDTSKWDEGCLLKLPFPIGSTVFRKNGANPIPYEISEYTLHEVGISIEAIRVYQGQVQSFRFSEGDIGKEIFATRQDALKALTKEEANFLR